MAMPPPALDGRLDWLIVSPDDVGFLVSNCLTCTDVCIDVMGTYSALCLIGFLVGDSMKCVYMIVIAIGMCFSHC